MATEEKRVIPVDIVDSIDSTNSYLKSTCATLPDRFTLRARTQTAGRGRFDRAWIAVPDEDLMFSTLVPVSPILQPLIIHVPQIVALAVHAVVEKCGVCSQIKWPNDILVCGKKLAGILVEGVFQGGRQYLVAGVGLNLNSFSRDGVTVESCSIISETGNYSDPDMVMNEILNEFYNRIDLLEQSGFAQFVPQLRSHLAYLGEKRVVTVGGTEIAGTIAGISDRGALLFQTADGTVEELISGEISFHRHV